MNAIAKYLLFLIFLMTVVYMATSHVLPNAYSFNGNARTAARDTKGQGAEIPNLAAAPSQVLTGLRNAGAIDFSARSNLTATGEEGLIKLWQLPAEQPVLEIGAGPEFQVLQVRFLPGRDNVAGCGFTPDGLGSVRIFNVATGKQTQQIDNDEPVIFMDFDQTGRYLVSTGMSKLKVWDLTANQAVAIVPRNSAGARGVFFRDDNFILQSDTLSLYDWRKKEPAAGLDNAGIADLKKINNNLSAWLSQKGLHTLRSPYGKREFIPFNAQGIYAFDLAPHGKWGLFLREDRTLSLIDGETGRTVKSLRLQQRPDGIFINPDGASAFTLYREGKIEVFDVGNDNIIRNAQYNTKIFFKNLGKKIGDLAKKLTLARNPAG